jgi:hypothetical protein
MCLRRLLRPLRQCLKAGRSLRQIGKSSRRMELEDLESRTLLSTIVWTNRGSANSDTDSFNAFFGTNASAARTIVDRAIVDWENVIGNFNYTNVGQPGFAPQANTYSVSISAGNLGAGTRGQTVINSIDPAGRPFNATITLDSVGGGPGWYFDPVPADNAEFTSLLTRFTASFTGTTPDFFRTAEHELGHAMGLALNNGLRLVTGGFLMNAGTDQVDGVSQLRLFSSGSTQVTFTANGGGHVYEGPAPANFPNVPVFPNELMNAGRALAAGVTRELITDNDANVLGAAYGYSITLPSTLQTFLANFNSVTGALTINGDPQLLNDTMTLDLPSNWRVNVDNVVAQFSSAAVTSVTFAASPGTDVLNVQNTLSGVSTTVNLGSSADTVNVRLSMPSGSFSLDTLGGDVTINGNNGGMVNINDQADAFNDTFTIATTGASATVQRDFSGLVTCNGVSSLVVDGGPGQTTGITYDVNSTLFGTPVTINAGTGNDTFNVLMASPSTFFSLDNLQGALTIHGNGGTDTLNVNDQADAFSGDQYTITSTTVQRTAEAAITFDSLEGIVINGACSPSVAITYTVQSTAVYTPVTINGGGGTDTLIGPNSSTIWYLSGANQGNSLMINNVFGLTVVTFTSMENLTGGSGADSYQFSPGASLSGTLNGGAGYNSLDYSPYITSGTAGVTVNLATGTATATGGVSHITQVTGTIANDTLIGDANNNYFYSDGGNDSMMGGGGNDTFYLYGEAATATTVIDGGTGTDSVQGNNLINTWNLTGLGAGSLNSITFSNVENLIGGSNNDVFVFNAGASVAGTINGGPGTNRLEYTQYITGTVTPTTTGVSVNLVIGTATATGGISNIVQVYGSHANDSLTGDGNANLFGSFGGNDSMAGGGGDDTFWLYGEAVTAASVIDGGTGNDLVWGNNIPNTWQLVGPGSGSVNGAVFNNIEALLGGTNADTFVFHPGATIAGLINGNAGVNALDYSAFTSGVVVNLGLSTTVGWGTMTGTGNIANIQNVTGGAGNDILVGDANANVLNGGGGRNVLIGGRGADSLIGGSDDDLLVAGYTSYDLNAAALQAILAEWQRTDESYATRVANLRSGVGAGSYHLVLNTSTTAGTVFDDGAADVLTGNAGTDWFWASLPQDSITDRAAGELVN